MKIEIKSDFHVENVEFKTTENLSELNFNEIESNEKVTYFLVMNNNKSDASYVLEFT